MKKLLGIFMAAVTVIVACVGFVGCNKDGTGQGTEEPPKTEEPAVVGEFKSLKDAYEAGWISHDDLKSIAYYYNAQIDDEYYKTNDFYDNNFGLVEYVPSPEVEFVPKPLNPEALSEDIINKIKPFYWTDVFVVPEGSVGLDKVYVTGYYGTYSDCVVIDITDGYFCKEPNSYLSRTIEIDGIKFYSKVNLPCPYVWRA